MKHYTNEMLQLKGIGLLEHAQATTVNSGGAGGDWSVTTSQIRASIGEADFSPDDTEFEMTGT